MYRGLDGRLFGTHEQIAADVVGSGQLVEGKRLSGTEVTAPSQLGRPFRLDGFTGCSSRCGTCRTVSHVGSSVRPSPQT